MTDENYIWGKKKGVGLNDPQGSFQLRLLYDSMAVLRPWETEKSKKNFVVKILD